MRELDWSILMARAQSGDKVAYRRLLDEISGFVRSLAAKAYQVEGDREDVVQEVLLTVHAIRHTYDPARPFGPWLVAIANRRIVDGLRRQGRLRAREFAFDDEDERIENMQAPAAQDGSDARALKRAVDGLPQAQREAIRLLKLEELSLKEASAASGMSIASLKVATHRALKSLKRTLKGET